MYAVSKHSLDHHYPRFAECARPNRRRQGVEDRSLHETAGYHQLSAGSSLEDDERIPDAARERIGTPGYWSTRRTSRGFHETRLKTHEDFQSSEYIVHEKSINR